MERTWTNRAEERFKEIYGNRKKLQLFPQGAYKEYCIAHH